MPIFIRNIKHKLKAFLCGALLLALSACSTLDTPEERYYAVKVAAKEVALEVTEKVDACKAKAINDPCRDLLPTVNKVARAMKSNVTEMDKIFVTKDSAYYDLSLSLTQNAVNDLKVILGGL